MMLLASTIYRILGWIVLIVGSIAALVYFVVSIVAMIGAFAMGGVVQGFFAVATGLFVVAACAFYVAIMVITCWFVSEAIRWMLDLQENTSKSNFLLAQLVKRMSK